MNLIKKIISVFVVFSLFFSSGIRVEAKENVFSYKITVESEDWFDYSVLEKVEMLRIDNNTLSNMNEEQLVHAIADYPYLVDIYVYGSIGEGLKIFAKYCDAFNELQRRNNWIEAFTKYSQIIIGSYDESPRKDGRTAFVSDALNDIADYYNNYTENDKNYYFTATRSAPQTPNGSPVSYSTPSEWHTTLEHSSADDEMVATYGVTLIRNGSCKYNCHSYAWHSTSASNIYWIDNPSIYMTDGSYTRKYNGGVSTSTALCYVSVYDKIYYASNTHSALFVDNPALGAPIATAKVRSKWGQLGVFEHTLTNVPAGYDCSSISVWH